MDLRSRLLSSDKGQMTLELVVMLPVGIAIALILVNALTFFGDCAAFDRLGRDAVRTFATSPGYGESVAECKKAVENSLSSFSDKSNEECEVRTSTTLLGLTQYDLRLVYHPTLFGLDMRAEIFGVSLPALTHEVSIAIESYKPGIFF